MSYEIMPPVDFWSVSAGVSMVASPDLRATRLALGVPQRSQIAPALVHFPAMRGERVAVAWQILRHGVPGTGLQDGFFPEDVKPQHRLSVYVPPTPPEIVVMLYHGEPGVLRGDDNWSQDNPSIRPQLRTNTLPHTEDPTIHSGTWRANEVFLPPAGV